MSSSDTASAVFGRGDPFYEPPSRPTHYHPSAPRKLSKREKKITLSPSRLRTEERPVQTAPDEAFLRSAPQFTVPTHDTPSPHSSRFDESWPSSERPSSVMTPEVLQPSPESDSSSQPYRQVPALQPARGRMDRLYPPSKPEDKKTGGEESTISKYIERFRHGQPLSREEREKRQEAAADRDFWWLSAATTSPSTPTSTSTPTDDRTGPLRDRGRTRRRESPQRLRDRSQSPSTPSKQPLTSTPTSVLLSPIEKETRALQEKAERLIERSSSALSEPAVSSDGLGHTSTSSVPTSLDEPAYRPAFGPRFYDKENVPEEAPPISAQLQPPSSRHHGDDILYQWRLRRKLEEARKPSAAAGPWTGASPPVRLSSVQQDGDQTTPLSAFRQRLAKSTGIDIVQPEPTQEAVPRPSHDAPVPSQLATEQATQTEVPKSSIVPSQEETIPSRSEGNMRKLDTSPPRRVADTVPIASPSLRGVSKQPVMESDDIVPHLHLECDIIPCPHPEVHDHVPARDRKTQLRSPERGRTRERRRELYREETSSETKTESDQDKRTQRQRERGSEESGSLEETSSEDSEVYFEQTDERRRQKSFRETDRKQKGNKEKYKLDRRQESMDRSERGGERKLRHRSREARERERAGHKQGRPAPPRHSSPKVAQSPVRSAIGQVVSQRLFTTPPGTPQSSVDSLPSTPPHPVPVHQDPSRQLPLLPQGIAVHADDLESSDGEEFSDDPLLMALRRQRAQYEEQLRIIDELLLRAADSGDQEGQHS